MSPEETDRKPLCDVSRRIRNNADSILKSWMAQVRREVPGAANLDDDSLKNSLSRFLSVLADVVSTSSETESGERSSIETLIGSQDHGRTRAQQAGYTLDQVISEYRILRSILFRELRQSGEIRERERQKLLESIDYGIMAAAVQFTAALGFKRASAADLERKGLREQLKEAREERDQARETSEELGKVTALLRVEREMRERFVAVLTHDLRNPLAAASMRVQLIQKQMAKSPALMALSVQLAHDIERADRMIGDLLDANRIRAGERVPLNPEELELTGLVRAVLDELTVVHGERFVLHAPGALHAFLDRSGIRRIVENLCNNAAKYGLSGAPVTVSLREQGSEVWIAVHNQGAQLSLADQKSLFEQFRRADAAEKSGKKGWGLGLTLVKGMTEAHGGKVQVESSADRGTTFTVTLPQDVRRSAGAANAR